MPLMRDIGQFMGGFEVTIQGFISALTSRKCVLVVPGGQAEMIHSRSDTTEMILNSKHSGFVRVALMTGSSLIPTVAFDETSLLDNARVPTFLQEWSMRKFRANFFTFPYGVAYLPLPRPIPYNLAVGKPITVPKVDNPSARLVDALHRHYYTNVVDLFQRYKHECDHSDHEIVLQPDLVPMTEQEWLQVMKEELAAPATHAPAEPAAATTADIGAAHSSAQKDAKSSKGHGHRRDKPLSLVHKPPGMFETFQRFETVWALMMMVMLYALIILRAWPTLSLLESARAAGLPL